MGDLQAKTIHELADLLASGNCGAAEITSDVLAAVDARNDGLNAYIALDAEQALADARSADDARAKGDTRPFLGIPIAVKDVLNIKGQTCTCASAILKGYRSPYDATCIANLRRAGFHFVGRLNMDEFAMGGSTENSIYGPARNPRNSEYVTGGSSGGSAAAVAGEIAVAAIGSDTGGSIRQPASFCGCVGLKPTYGRVSRYGLVAFASSLDQVGPLTRDVIDAAILLEHLSGHDPMDSTSIDQPVPEFGADASTSLKGMRLGMPKEYFVDGMDPDVAKAVRDAVDVCAYLGAEIVDVSLPHTEYAIAVYYIIATAEASSNLARFDGVRYGSRISGDDPIELYGKTRLAGFGNEVKRRIILGTYVLSSGYYDAYYLRAQKVRTLLRRDFEGAFGRCDAIVAPVAPSAAFKIGEKVNNPLQMYLGDLLTVPANLAGIPGISVPCGLTGEGLPIGLQILGPDFGEQAILKVAHAYEQTNG
jgi:aspartyl-tRNA(Asn)/glutamyl-tRNA(Gln) amidotransferase subunit A